MAQLAIKGHADRGDEVIKILELLGGKNSNHNVGKYINRLYFINDNGYIESTNNLLKYLHSTVLTLEEVEALMPYKIGDKVLHEDEIYEITGVGWHRYYDKIVYDAKGEKNKLLLFDPNKFKPVMNNEEFQNKLLKIYSDDKTGHIQLIPHKDYEIKEINGDFVIIKKQPKYPTTFNECCEVLMGKTDFQDFALIPTKFSTTRYKETVISSDPPHISLINNFYKLLICRDAYWKIAEKQMELNKPWEPDWETGLNKYCLTICENQIIKCIRASANAILAFPTEEMRDAFYENFKELIEECKELL